MLFLFLILINILLRYPFTPHEIGWDSFVIHSLADSINVQHHADWILNPFSYFGMYPLSYPSSVPFIISSTSQASGLSIEGVAWIFTIIIGILAALGGFILAGAIKKNFWFQYIVALMFSTSMGLLLFTTWTLTTRGTLEVILPFFLWSLINHLKSQRLTYFILAIMFLILAASIHRMFILFAPFILLIMIIPYIIKSKLIAKTSITESKQKKMRIIFGIGSFIVAGVLLILPILGVFGDVYGHFGVEGTYNSIVWAAAVFARNVGPIALLSIIGLILIILKVGKERGEFFTAGAFIIIIPMILVGSYISTFSMIFFCLIAGFGIILLLKNQKKRKKLVLSGITLLLISSFVLSAYTQVTPLNILSSEDTVDSRYLENSGYDAAIWCKFNNVSLMTGSGQITQRMSALSGVPRFPGNSAQNIIFDLTYPGDLEITTRSFLDPYFYLEGPVVDSTGAESQITWYYVRLMNIQITNQQAVEILSTYQVEWLVFNNYQVFPNTFTKSAMQTSYCMFNNEKVSLWYIDSSSW